MKRLSTLDVRTDSSLRVRRHTIVFTGDKANSSPNEKIIQKEQASFNHITMGEVDDSNFEIELAETPKTLEDGG